MAGIQEVALGLWQMGTSNLWRCFLRAGTVVVGTLPLAWNTGRGQELLTVMRGTNPASLATGSRCPLGSGLKREQVIVMWDFGRGKPILGQSSVSASLPVRIFESLGGGGPQRCQHASI